MVKQIKKEKKNQKKDKKEEPRQPDLRIMLSIPRKDLKIKNNFKMVVRGYIKENWGELKGYNFV